MRIRTFVGLTLLIIWMLGIVLGSDAETPPRGVFRPWDGEWQGEFIIYGPGGEKTVLQVKHVYRSRNDSYQEGTIFDKLPDGNTVQKNVVNTIENGDLRCRVYRQDGTLEVEHHGVYVDGHIHWSSTDDKGRLRQFFRERVIDDAYSIEGFGIYGPNRETVEIYTARYTRTSRKPRQ